MELMLSVAETWQKWPGGDDSRGAGPQVQEVCGLSLGAKAVKAEGGA